MGRQAGHPAQRGSGQAREFRGNMQILHRVRGHPPHSMHFPRRGLQRPAHRAADVIEVHMLVVAI